MSSKQQYIDLFNENRVSVEAHSACVMNAHRDAALAALDGVSLPRKGEENYEVSDIEEMFAPDYGVNTNRVEVDIDPAEAFKCDVPNMSTCLYYFFNDIYHSSRTSGNTLPQGVIVESMKEASKNHKEIIERYYGKLAPLSDGQVALNTLLAQDGIFVYVPKGVVMERTLQLVNILNASQPMMVARRVLVVVGECAQAKMLVCDHTQNKDIDYLSNQVVEIFAETGAVVDYYDMEESSERTHRVSSMWVKQEAGSNVLVNGITLSNGETRNNYHIDVDGEGAETHLLGMSISSGLQHIDNHTYIGHNVGHCHSNELFKYVLEDEAVGAFTGKILVAPGAPKVEAYQSNRNICASKTAKMHTKPQLEIYTDDVKCSHGATVGQLDQEALFYMQTRGIPLNEARTLLMQAFMGDVIDAVRLDALKDRLRHLVEKRFAGTLAQCVDCGNVCHERIKMKKN